MRMENMRILLSFFFIIFLCYISDIININININKQVYFQFVIYPKDLERKMDQGPIEGILKYADGSKYEGQLKNNKLDGFGIFYRPDGSKKYEGEFQAGNYHGKGIWYRADGSKWYEGGLVSGMRNGVGT